jgi:peptidoglycan-associated lipoprotein
MIRVRQSLTAGALVATVAVAAAGCRKETPQVAPPPPPVAAAPKPAAPPPPPPPPPAPKPPAPPALTEDEIFAKKTVEQLNAERPLGDTFFDLDSSEIREDARPILQKNSDWLKRWTSTQITVEGHCDSRGSSEYNLALGSRRATAVKDYLVSLGVPANRVTVVSKGKEQPFCNEETEGCWQQNRRGHFLITAK